MRITDKIKRALGGMSAETIEERIEAVKQTMRDTRAAIAQAEDDLNLCGITGQNETEAAANLAELREKLARLPDQLDALKQAQHEAYAIQIEKEAMKRVAVVQNNLAALKGPYDRMMTAVREWNEAVANGGDLGSSFFNEGVNELHVGKSIEGRYQADMVALYGGIPDLEKYSTFALSLVERNAREDARAARSIKEQEFHAPAIGTMHAIENASRRNGTYNDLKVAAKAGNVEAKVALALGEY